jgi:hypothetical protein
MSIYARKGRRGSKLFIHRIEKIQRKKQKLLRLAAGEDEVNAMRYINDMGTSMTSQNFPQIPVVFICIVVCICIVSIG